MGTLGCVFIDTRVVSLNARQAKPGVHLVTGEAWSAFSRHHSSGDNETHESGVTKYTTGEAWSAFSRHHSRVFHCQWTHYQVFLLLSHMLIQNAKSIFIYVMKYVSGFIWKLGINFAVCIKWIYETWWNNRLLLVPNCYEVVAMVATMVAMVVAPLGCHTLR